MNPNNNKIEAAIALVNFTELSRKEKKRKGGDAPKGVRKKPKISSSSSNKVSDAKQREKYRVQKSKWRTKIIPAKEEEEK